MPPSIEEDLRELKIKYANAKSLPTPERIMRVVAWCEDKLYEEKTTEKGE